MDIERNTSKKAIKIKSSWVTMFILVATMLLIMVQAWNVFYGEEPEQYNLAQASSNEDLSGLTEGDASSSSSEDDINPSDYTITLNTITTADDLLQIDFSYSNYDPLEGKIYPGFYFDEYVDTNSSYLYYGMSPFELSTELLPIDAAQVCVSLFTANLEHLETTESCLDLP